MCMAKCVKQLSSGKNSLKSSTTYIEMSNKSSLQSAASKATKPFCTLELLQAISLVRLSLIFDFMAFWTDQLLLSKPLWLVGFGRLARLQPRITITNGLQMFIFILSQWNFYFLFWLPTDILWILVRCLAYACVDFAYRRLWTTPRATVDFPNLDNKITCKSN